MNDEQRTMTNEQLTKKNEPWTMNNEQWAINDEQWNKQWAMNYEHLSNDQWPISND